MKVKISTKIFPPSCLCPEPKFIGSFWVPESENPDDDKVFFFFRETAVEAQGLGKSTYSRIGQLCRVRRRYGSADSGVQCVGKQRRAVKKPAQPWLVHVKVD